MPIPELHLLLVVWKMEQNPIFWLCLFCFSIADIYEQKQYAGGVELWLYTICFLIDSWKVFYYIFYFFCFSLLIFQCCLPPSLPLPSSPPLLLCGWILLTIKWWSVLVKYVFSFKRKKSWSRISLKFSHHNIFFLQWFEKYNLKDLVLNIKSASNKPNVSL